MNIKLLSIKMAIGVSFALLSVGEAMCSCSLLPDGAPCWDDNDCCSGDCFFVCTDSGSTRGLHSGPGKSYGLSKSRIKPPKQSLPKRVKN